MSKDTMDTKATQDSNMTESFYVPYPMTWLEGGLMEDYMDVYNHLANKQDIREEVERYAIVVGN